MEDEAKEEEAPKSLLDGYGNEPDPYAVLHEAMCEVGSELSRLYREDADASTPRVDHVQQNMLQLMAQSKGNPGLTRSKSSRRVGKPSQEVEPSGLSFQSSSSLKHAASSVHTLQLFHVPDQQYAYHQQISYAEQYFGDSSKEWENTVQGARPAFTITAAGPESPHVAFHLPDEALYSPDAQQDDDDDNDSQAGEQQAGPTLRHSSTDGYGSTSKPPALKVGALSNLLDLFAAENSPGPLIKPRQLQVEAALGIPKGVSLAKHKDAYSSRPSAPQQQPSCSNQPRYEPTARSQPSASAPASHSPTPPVYLTGPDTGLSKTSNDSMGRGRPGNAIATAVPTSSQGLSALELGRLTTGPPPPAAPHSASSPALTSLASESSQGSISATSSPAKLPPKPRMPVKPKPGLESSSSEIMGLPGRQSLSSRTSPLRGRQLEPLQNLPGPSSPAQVASEPDCVDQQVVRSSSTSGTPQTSSRHVTPTKPRLAPMQPSLGGALMAVLSTQCPTVAPSAANILPLAQITAEPEPPPLQRCMSPTTSHEATPAERLEAPRSVASSTSGAATGRPEATVGALGGSCIPPPRTLATSQMMMKPTSLPPTPPRPAAALRPRNAASSDVPGLSGLAGGQNDSPMRSSPALIGANRPVGASTMLFRSRDPSPVHLRASSNNPSRDSSPTLHAVGREHAIASSDHPQLNILRKRSSAGESWVCGGGGRDAPELQPASRLGSISGNGFLPPIISGSRHTSRDPSPAGQSAARRTSRDPSPLHRKAGEVEASADDLNMVPSVPGMRRATERQMMEAAHEIKYGPAWKPGGLNPKGTSGSTAKYSDSDAERQPRIPKGSELLQSAAPLPSLTQATLLTVPGQEFKIEYR